MMRNRETVMTVMSWPFLIPDVLFEASKALGSISPRLRRRPCLDGRDRNFNNCNGKLSPTDPQTY